MFYIMATFVYNAVPKALQNPEVTSVSSKNQLYSEAF